MRLLIVEDNQDAWISLQSYFSSHGHYAFWASRAIEAIRFLVTEEIDVALIDVDLGPGELSGLDIVRVMIKDERLSKIPAVLMSGHTTEQIRQRAQSALVDVLHYVHPVILGKPLELEEVEREIRSAIAHGAR